MKSLETFECKIYLGLKEGYDGIEHLIEEVEEILQNDCDTNGFAYTLTPTRFIYKNGNENGCIIGVINYPRFPRDKSWLKAKTYHLTQQLLKIFKQERISIVCTDDTIMVESNEN